MGLKIPYRKWFIDRYIKELEDINKSRSGNTDSGTSNDNISNLNEYESLLNKKFSNDI